MKFGEDIDHAVAVTMQWITWFMFVDPEFSKKWLVPIVAFGHPTSDAAKKAWGSASVRQPDTTAEQAQGRKVLHVAQAAKLPGEAHSARALREA